MSADSKCRSAEFLGQHALVTVDPYWQLFVGSRATTPRQLHNLAALGQFGGSKKTVTVTDGEKAQVDFWIGG